MKKLILPTMLAVGLLASCATSNVKTQDQEVLTIAPETKECSAGVQKKQCMLVKQDNQTDWQYFYDNIDGFTYEPGFEYKVVVEKTKIENPPADASSLNYKLVKVISKKTSTLK